MVFRQVTDLAAHYQQLIDRGIRLFVSQDMMRFQSRKVPATGGCHGNFLGEVVSDLCGGPSCAARNEAAGLCSLAHSLRDLAHRVDRP